jgi:hypothetical protein
MEFTKSNRIKSWKGRKGIFRVVKQFIANYDTISYRYRKFEKNINSDDYPEC